MPIKQNNFQDPSWKAKSIEIKSPLHSFPQKIFDGELAYRWSIGNDRINHKSLFCLKNHGRS
jgi:hypothetical protein